METLKLEVNVENGQKLSYEFPIHSKTLIDSVNIFTRNVAASLEISAIKQLMAGVLMIRFCAEYLCGDVDDRAVEVLENTGDFRLMKRQVRCKAEEIAAGIRNRFLQVALDCNKTSRL